MAATSQEVSVCEYCHIGMKGEKELVEHLSKGGGHVFKCRVKQAMEMVRMAENGERKFVCKLCGKGFKTIGVLIQHNSVHTKQRSFVCDVEGCAKNYTERGGLSKHKNVVHEGSSYECPKCGKRFGQKSRMTRHFKIVHEGKKDYKCVVCGAQFGRNSHLTGHTKSVHENVRAFKCEHCYQSFSQSGNRKVHMERVHSNIHYPCTWPDCTHQASTKTNRKCHVRRAHTKDDNTENVQPRVKKASSGPAPSATKKSPPSICTPSDNQDCIVTKNSSKKGSIGSNHGERSSLMSTEDKIKETSRISAQVPASTVRVRSSARLSGRNKEQVDEKSKKEIEKLSLKQNSWKSTAKKYVVPPKIVTRLGIKAGCKGKLKKCSEDFQEKVVRFGEEEGWKAVADKFGVEQQHTVGNGSKKFGIKNKRGRNLIFDDEFKEKVFQYGVEQNSWKEAALKFGVSPKTVTCWVRKAGHKLMKEGRSQGDLSKSGPESRWLRSTKGIEKVDDSEDSVVQFPMHLKGCQEQVDPPPSVSAKDEFLFNDQIDEPSMVIVKEECLLNDLLIQPMETLKEECHFNDLLDEHLREIECLSEDQLDQPSMEIVKEESLFENQLDQTSMVIVREEYLFNDQLEPQLPMVIVKEECLSNDQIDSIQVIAVKEECVDVEDSQNFTDISPSDPGEREEHSEED